VGIREEGVPQADSVGYGEFSGEEEEGGGGGGGGGGDFRMG